MRSKKQVWERDDVQFARLLAEIKAVGLTAKQTADLKASMDLSTEQICELLDRAEEAFESMKETMKDGPNSGLVHVEFYWSDAFGECYDCGRPAAFVSSEHNSDPENKRCAICAANDASGGATIQRIDAITDDDEEVET